MVEMNDIRAGILEDTANIPDTETLTIAVIINRSDEFMIHHINELGINGIEYFIILLNNFLSKEKFLKTSHTFPVINENIDVVTLANI